MSSDKNKTLISTFFNVSFHLSILCNLFLKPFSYIITFIIKCAKEIKCISITFIYINLKRNFDLKNNNKFSNNLVINLKLANISSFNLLVKFIFVAKWYFMPLNSYYFVFKYCIVQRSHQSYHYEI